MITVGENPEPPLGRRRVLISHSRWGDDPSALTEDEWGAILRYPLGSPGARANAEAYAAQWAEDKTPRVDQMYIEVDPDA